MKLKVRVVPGAKKIKVNFSDKLNKVHLTSTAQEGKANKQLMKVLADHLGVKKRKILIIAGEKSRDKLIEINE